MSTDEQVAVPIRVTGGQGGHFAVTEDLVRASWVLAAAAAEVNEAAHQLRMAAFWLMQARPDAVAGVSAAISHAHGQVDKALTGHDGADALAEELTDASRRVSDVAEAYETAEGQSAGTLLRTAATPLRLPLGLLYKAGAASLEGMAGAADFMGVAQDAGFPVFGIPSKALATAWRGAAGAASRTGDRLLPKRPRHITDVLNGSTVAALLGSLDRSLGPLPTRYENTAGMLSVVISLLERFAGEPLYTGVVPRIGSQTEVAGATGAADLIAGLEGIDPGGPGAIVIDTTVLPDGTRTHVVRVPGTRDNWVADPSTLDYGSNVAAIVGKESDSERMLLDALATAGIGPDEPIMLVGHSQGGIIAAKVAASVGSKYNVTHVTAVGSPTDRLVYAPHIEYLIVRHDQDLVHGLDGKAPPDLPHVTLVEASLQEAHEPWLVEAAGGIASSHAVSAYVPTGKAIDTSQHPSLKAWRASASDYLGGGQATRREYAPTFREPGSDAVKPEPRPRPWPGDLVAECRPPESGARTGAASPSILRGRDRPPVLPTLPGPLSLADVLSPQLDTVAPVPAGDAAVNAAWCQRSLP